MPRTLKTFERKPWMAPGHVAARGQAALVAMASVILVAALGGPSLLARAAGDQPSTAQSPEGLGLLILLIGLTAVGLVAMTIIGRTMPTRAAADFDDDELIRDEDELQ